MSGDFSLVYSIRFDCAPSQLEPTCHVALPHGSPLGKYDNLLYQPTERWPATFLCLRHGVACVRLPEDIQSNLEMRIPGAPLTPVWQIGCTCCHAHCGRRHTIYTAYTAKLPTWPEVWRRILKLSPRIPCGDHMLEWRKDLMRGTAYTHN